MIHPSWLFHNFWLKLLSLGLATLLWFTIYIPLQKVSLQKEQRGEPVPEKTTNNPPVKPK